jgi:hypothetical protein
MKSSTALFALIALALSTGTSDARRSRSRRGGESFVANGTFGLGLELGAPFGLNGKYFLRGDRALNFGIGAVYDSYYYDDRDGLHLYLDYLFHPFTLTKQPAFQMPFFLGIGGRLWDFNDRRDRFEDDGFALGLRVPVGVAIDFNRVPLDIFFQIAFVADVFFDYADDRYGPHLEGSVGLRYWFD